MRYSISLVLGTAMLIGAMLGTAACGAREAQDIEPVSSVEAEAAAESAQAQPPAVVTPVTPTQPRPEPTKSPATELQEESSSIVPTPTGPTMPASAGPATELPTEIQEGSSPIVPTPTGKAAMPANKLAAPPPGSETALAAAVADLAKQRGLPPAQITVVSVEAVDWNDTSLGCPQEGMMYAQVITPGYKFVLAAGGKEYTYHTDQQKHVVLCEK